VYPPLSYLSICRADSGRRAFAAIFCSSHTVQFIEVLAHLLLVGSRAAAIAHTHAAEPEGRDFQLAATQWTSLRFVSPSRCHPLTRIRVVCSIGLVAVRRHSEGVPTIRACSLIRWIAALNLLGVP
jgi:hypothetical protein